MSCLQHSPLILEAFFNFLFLIFLYLLSLKCKLHCQGLPEVRQFKSSVKLRCTLVNLTGVGKKSPLPTVLSFPSRRGWVTFSHWKRLGHFSPSMFSQKPGTSATTENNLVYKQVRCRVKMNSASFPVSRVSLLSRD